MALKPFIKIASGTAPQTRRKTLFQPSPCLCLSHAALGHSESVSTFALCHSAVYLSRPFRQRRVEMAAVPSLSAQSVFILIFVSNTFQFAVNEVMSTFAAAILAPAGEFPFSIVSLRYTDFAQLVSGSGSVIRRVCI